MSGFIGPGGGGGVPAGYGNIGNLLFEWNGVDTSQFDPPGSPAFADGGAAATLSVVASATAPGGSVLRLAGTAGVAACYVLLATAPLPFVGTRRNYYYEIEVENIIAGAGGYVGFSFFGEVSGSYFGYNWFPAGVSGWKSRIDAGVRIFNATTNLSFFGFSFWAFKQYGAKVVGVGPKHTVYGTSITTLEAASAVAARGRMTNNPGGANWFGEPAAASWDPLVNCNRWGLALQSSGGNGLAGVTCDYKAIRIWDLLDNT